MDINYQALLERCPHISIEGMDRNTWLEKRQKSIGGSDVGAIMGLSDYGSRLTVYLQKKGIVKNDEESPAAHRGKILEPVVRQVTREQFPDILAPEVPYMFNHPEYSHMGANIDGLIFADKAVTIGGKEIQGMGGHEIKSSKTGYGFGDEEIPDAYFAQVQHYMEVLDLPWFLLSVYIMDNDSIKHYVIDKNPEFIADMLAQEKDFWENYLEKSIMPAAAGIDNEEDMITGMFSGSETLVLDEAQRGLCADYVSLTHSIKEMEDKKIMIKIYLMETIVQQAKGTPEDRKVSAIAGPYSVSWITVERRDVDRDALKKAGLYEKFQKVSTYDRFTVTEKKGA
jgi:putative phage-type endonuclease